MKKDEYGELRELYNKQFARMMKTMGQVGTLASKLSTVLKAEDTEITMDPNENTTTLALNLDKQDTVTLTHKEEDGYQNPTVILTFRRKDE